MHILLIKIRYVLMALQIFVNFLRNGSNQLVPDSKVYIDLPLLSEPELVQ